VRECSNAFNEGFEIGFVAHGGVASSMCTAVCVGVGVDVDVGVGGGGERFASLVSCPRARCHRTVVRDFVQ
jgi:hypothetical protein